MKLLYETASGQVLARYGDTPLPSNSEPTPHDGQSLIDVPDTVSIPDAVIRVVPHTSEEGQTTYKFVMDEEAVANLWRSVKTHRNQLLKDSDWICSVTDYCPPNKDQWVAYRQALRDITAQPNPFRLVWPKEPSLSLPASQPASAPSDTHPASSESTSAVSASESTSAVSASEPQSPPSSSEPAPSASDSQPASESASSDPASAPSDPASESASEPSSSPSDPTSESASEPASAPSADSTSASESASESAVPASDPVV